MTALEKMTEILHDFDLDVFETAPDTYFGRLWLDGGIVASVETNKGLDAAIDQLYRDADHLRDVFELRPEYAMEPPCYPRYD